MHQSLLFIKDKYLSKSINHLTSTVSFLQLSKLISLQDSSSDVQHHIPDPVKVHPIGRRMYITAWHKLARCFLAPLLVVVCIITDQHGLIELLLLIALQVVLWILPEVVSKILGETDILAEIRGMQLLLNLEERYVIDLRDLKTIEVRDGFWACWPTRITLKGAAGTKEITTSIHQPSFIKLLKSINAILPENDCRYS